MTYNMNQPYGAGTSPLLGDIVDTEGATLSDPVSDPDPEGPEVDAAGSTEADADADTDQRSASE